MPSASVQNAAEVSAISTTSRMAATKSFKCCSVAMSGGAAFNTMKLLSQIWVRILDRAAFVEFVLESLNDVRVIMSDVVYAVAGEKIENERAVSDKEFAAGATLIFNIHAQQG